MAPATRHHQLATPPAFPIHIIAEGRTAEFKRRFLGTHFFNPPRYLHLLEIIPTPDTDPAMVKRMKDFAENVLGKGVVVCKDTPNFIANRMISFIQSDLMEYAIENGYTRGSGGYAHRPAAGPPQDRHLPPQRHRRHRRDGAWWARISTA